MKDAAWSRRPQAYPLPATNLLFHYEVKLFATSSDSFFIRLAKGCNHSSGREAQFFSSSRASSSHFTGRTDHG